MKKVFILILSLTLLLCISVNVFAVSPDYTFYEVEVPSNLNDYEAIPLNTYWITSDDPFNFWPGALYYCSIMIDSSLLASSLSTAASVKDSNNKFFMILTPDQILFADGQYYDATYFDPSAGGEVRYFQITSTNRSYLTSGFNIPGVDIYLYYYDGQSGVVEAGSGVMNIVTAYVDEVVLHWPLVLFCIVLPVLSVTVSIIVSFRERRDKN